MNFKFAKLFVLLLTVAVVFSSCKKDKNDPKPGIADGYWDFSSETYKSHVIHKVGDKLDYYEHLEGKEIKKVDDYVGVMKLVGKNELKSGWEKPGTSEHGYSTDEIVEMTNEKIVLKGYPKNLVVKNVKDLVVVK